MKSESLVSVIIPVYNADRFVSQAIESVLQQTHKNLQIVIVNDGSTDKSLAKINEFKDSRIEVVDQLNQGTSTCLNNGIDMAKGDYVAILSGDDMALPCRIEKSLELVSQNHVPIVFSGAEIIDEEGNLAQTTGWASGLFPEIQLSRWESLERLFSQGNYFNATSFFCERRILPERPFNPAFLQLQDFDLWIRLLKKHHYVMSSEHLVQYRVQKLGSNLSSPTRAHRRRTANETAVVLESFFEDISDEDFAKIFAPFLKFELSHPNFDRSAEEILLLLSRGLPQTFVLGFSRLSKFLEQADRGEKKSKAQTDYSLTNAFLYDRSKRTDVFSRHFSADVFGEKRTGTLFYAGEDKGFSESASIESQYLINEDFEFEVSFDLSSRGSDSTWFRFDPIEGERRKLSIEKVLCVDVEGRELAINLKGAENNAMLIDRGWLYFDSLDPQFLFMTPAVSGVVSLKISGKLARFSGSDIGAFFSKIRDLEGFSATSN